MSMELSNKVMLVGLRISVFSGEKMDRAVTDQIAATHQVKPREAGKYNKIIISKHAVEPIRKIAGAARERHYTLTLPWSDVGGRLLSVDGYFRYFEEMRILKSKFLEEIDIFVKAYPTLIEEARVRLNGMFDAEDYPPINTLLQRFDFDTSASPLPTTQNWFLDLAEEELTALKIDADNRLAVNIEAAVKDTYARISDVTGKMVERLRKFDDRDPTTGKPLGVFRDSLINNVRELTDILPSLNITGDQALANLTTEMRETLCKFDAGALREDAAFRASTAAAAESIFNKVQGLMS